MTDRTLTPGTKAIPTSNENPWPHDWSHHHGICSTCRRCRAQEVDGQGAPQYCSALMFLEIERLQSVIAGMIQGLKDADIESRSSSETCDVRQPIPVKEIVVALEREANGVPLTDPRWLAAGQLREMADWRNRTLMCRIDMRPPQIVEATAPKANSVGPQCNCQGEECHGIAAASAHGHICRKEQW